MQLSHIATRSRRRGFTLIEILVVIGIIAVLAALIGAGIMVWIPAQQGRNTQGTIRTVNKIFQEQWTYVIEQAKKESPSAAVLGVVGGDAERARVLWIKVRLVEAFPMTYSEVNNNAAGTDPIFNVLYVNAGSGSPLIPGGQRKYLAAYKRSLANAGGPVLQDNSAASSPVRPAHWTESSACLLMALSVSRGGSVLVPDTLGSSVNDTDGDGIKEIVDGWRTPLQFYRFAWGSSAIPGNPIAPNGIQGLNPAAASSKSFKLADPLDQSGALLTWPGGGARAAYEGYAHQIAVSGPGGMQPPTNYVIPVLLSVGPDTDLFKGAAASSLYSPTQCGQMGLTVQNPATAADNIYSFNLKGN